MALLTNNSPLFNALSKSSGTVQDTMENAGISLNTESKTVQLNVESNAENLEPILTQIVELLNTIESKGGNLKNVSNYVSEVTKSIVDGSADATKSVNDLTLVFQQLFGTILQSKEVKQTIDDLNQSILNTQQNLSNLNGTDLSALHNQIKEVNKSTENSVNNNYSALNNDLKKILQDLNQTKVDIQNQIANQNNTIQNASNSLQSDELKTAISSLYKKTKEEESNIHKSKGAWEKINKMLSSSAKDTDNIFKSFSERLQTADKKLREVVDGFDKAAQSIKNTAMSLPSGLGADWMLQNGMAGGISGGANWLVNSGLGRLGLGAADKFMGTTLSDINFLDTDVNKKVIQLMYNPTALGSYSGIKGYTRQDIQSNAIGYAEKEEENIYNVNRMALIRNYGVSKDSLNKFTIDDENEYFRASRGQIEYGTLAKNYELFAPLARSDADAQFFSKYAALTKETRGLDTGDIQGMVELYYRDMKLSIDDTIASMEKMNKLALTSNIPLSELTKALKGVVETYRQAGISAENAEDVFTHFINMGFSARDAQEFAQNFSRGMEGFAGKDSDVIFSGILQGQSDPFQSLFNANYIDESGEVWAHNMAGNMDTMLNFTRSMFGNGALGDTQVLKKLQDYGFSRRQSSRIFDKLESGDMQGLESLLEDTSMQSVEEIEADSNKKLEDMLTELKDISANVGVITGTNADITATTKDETGTVESLAKQSEEAIKTMLEAERTAFKTDYTAITNSLENGALKTVITDNYTELTRTNELLESLKGILTGGILTNILGGLLNVLGKVTNLIPKIPGFEGITKTIQGDTFFQGATGAANSIAGTALNVGFGAVTGFAVDYTMNGLYNTASDAGIFDKATTEFMNDNQSGKTVATTIAGALGGYLGGPGGALIASELASGTSVAISKFFGDLAEDAGFYHKSEYGQKHDVTDKEIDFDELYESNKELYSRLGLTKENMFQEYENTGHTNFEQVMIYGNLGDGGFFNAGGNKYRALNGQVVTVSKEEQDELSYATADFASAKSNQDEQIQDYNQQKSQIYGAIDKIKDRQLQLLLDYKTVDENGNPINNELTKDIINRRYGNGDIDVNKLSVRGEEIFYGESSIGKKEENEALYNSITKTTELNATLDENIETMDNVNEEQKKLIESNKELKEAVIKLADKDFKVDMTGLQALLNTSNTSTEKTFNELIKDDKTFADVFAHYSTSSEDFFKGTASNSKYLNGQLTQYDDSTNSDYTQTYTVQDAIEDLLRSNDATGFTITGAKSTTDDTLMDLKGIIANNNEVFYEITKNGETSYLKGTLDDLSKWVTEDNTGAVLNIMGQKLTDLTEVAQQINNDTTSIDYKTPDKQADSSLKGWLGQGQMILTNTALHSSSYLNGNASSTTDWNKIRANIENAGGGIGYAYDSMGQSRAIYMGAFGGDSYEQRIKTVQSYGNRGGYGSYTKIDVSGITYDVGENILTSVNKGIKETGVTATMNTRILTTTMP